MMDNVLIALAGSTALNILLAYNYYRAHVQVLELGEIVRLLLEEHIQGVVIDLRKEESDESN